MRSKRRAVATLHVENWHLNTSCVAAWLTSRDLEVIVSRASHLHCMATHFVAGELTLWSLWLRITVLLAWRLMENFANGFGMSALLATFSYWRANHSYSVKLPVNYSWQTMWSVTSVYVWRSWRDIDRANIYRHWSIINNQLLVSVSLKNAVSEYV